MTGLACTLVPFVFHNRKEIARLSRHVSCVSELHALYLQLAPARRDQRNSEGRLVKSLHVEKPAPSATGAACLPALARRTKSGFDARPVREFNSQGSQTLKMSGCSVPPQTRCVQLSFGVTRHVSCEYWDDCVCFGLFGIRRKATAINSAVEESRGTRPEFDDGEHR